MIEPPRGAGRGRCKLWAAYIALMFVGIALACEALVQAYSWLAFPKMMTVDPDLGWYHSTNRRKEFTTEGETSLVVQNRLGHRGPDYPDVKVPGKHRVLVLGDSFTDGSHVGEDDLFTALIAKAHPEWEVMNAGVGAWSAVQEYLYLRNKGIYLGADLVLVMFFVNDLWENSLPFAAGMGPRPYATVTGGELTVHERPPADEWRQYVLPLPFAERLNRYSLAYRFLNTRIYQKIRAPHLRQMERDAISRIEREQPVLELQRLIYRRMALLLRERRIAFGIAIIPSFPEVEAGVARAEASMLTFCEEERLPCISLLPAMRRALDTGRRPYFREDIHWNREGHRIAAEALKPFVQTLLTGPR